MPAEKEGLRVRVFSGDTKVELGYGTLVGFADVIAFQMPDDSLSSFNDAENTTQEQIDAIKAIGGEARFLLANPKIILDNDTVVYGCQVWWEPVEENDEETLAD